MILEYFNSSSFPRNLRIFWSILQTTQFDSLTELRGYIKIGAINSAFSSRIHFFDGTQKKTHLARFKICTQSLEMLWLKAVRAICSSLIFPYSLVTVQVYWISTGAGFWRTSPQRSIKFRNSTSRADETENLKTWLPPFVMTGLLIRIEVKRCVASIDMDFTTNSSETPDTMYPSRLSTFFRVKLPVITNRNR